MIAQATDLMDIDMDLADVAGMKCRLMPHQVQGHEWMKKREEGAYAGGILADDMGLGKVSDAAGTRASLQLDADRSTGRRCKCLPSWCPAAPLHVPPLPPMQRLSLARQVRRRAGPSSR